jgi:hypothetical protein
MKVSVEKGVRPKNRQKHFLVSPYLARVRGNNDPFRVSCDIEKKFNGSRISGTLERGKENEKKRLIHVEMSPESYCACDWGVLESFQHGALRSFKSTLLFEFQDEVEKYSI